MNVGDRVASGHPCPSCSQDELAVVEGMYCDLSLALLCPQCDAQWNVKPWTIRRQREG